MTGIRATVELAINAPREKVWAALTDPGMVRQYFFGTNLEADWRAGGEITYSGEWEGKPYRDRGHVLEIDPPNRLVTDYYSAFSGLPDTPENYQRITYALSGDSGQTKLTVTQDNCRDQAAADHSAGNWMAIMKGMKDLVEKNS